MTNIQTTETMKEDKTYHDSADKETVRAQRLVLELAKTVERMADDEDSVCVLATADEHKARVVAGAAYRRVADMLRAESGKLQNQ